jgi:cytochrome c biogenesis protein CcdA
VTREPIAALIDLVVITFAALIGRSISSYAITTDQSSRRERLAVRLGRHFTASNLVAELSHEQQPPRTLYLVAHYDSKSQRWPLVMRIALFTLLIPGTLVVLGAALLNVTSGLIDGLAVVIILASALLVLLGTGNASPGAIDNASGVGTVLHLAEILAARSDWRERLRVIILLTSAEELGLMGATAYVKRHAAQLQADNALVLNFDGVGIAGELQWVGAASSELVSLITTAAREENVSIRRFRFIGALFDHVPFAQRGLDAVSLITVGRASRSVHTARDAIDQLHVSGFDQAGRVALQVIGKLVD